MGLESRDIEGASPRDLKTIKGLKRSDFFPHIPEVNDFYDK